MYGRVAAMTLGLLVALALAACGGQSTGQSSGQSSGASSSSGKSGPLVIGMTIEKTGPLNVLAPAAVGAQDAVNYLNANGGVNGHPVKLIVQDNASNSSRSIQSVEQLVQQGASVIVGPAFIQDCFAITGTVAKLKVPNVCATPSVLPSLAPPYQYGIGPATNQQDEEVYKFFAGRGEKKVGILAASDVSGTQAQQDAKADASAYHISIQVGLTNPAATTFKPQLEKMMANGVQALYYTSCGGISITAAGEALSLGFKGPIMLINCFASASVAKSVESLANGQLMTPVPEFMVNPPYTPQRQAADELYKQKVGTNEVTVADGWDTVLLAAAAAKKAASVTHAALNSTLETNFTYWGPWAGGTFTAQDHRGQSVEGVLVPAQFTKAGGFTRVK